jgi:hypothetical protein
MEITPTLAGPASLRIVIGNPSGSMALSESCSHSPWLRLGLLDMAFLSFELDFFLLPLFFEVVMTGSFFS